jgi:hypothetical protein
MWPTVTTVTHLPLKPARAYDAPPFNLKSEVKELALVLVLLLVLENANVSPSGRWNKMITGEAEPFYAGQPR